MNSVKHSIRTALILAACTFGYAQAQAPDLESMDIVTRSIPDGPVALVDDSPIEKLDYVLFYQGELARYAARNNTEVADVTELDRVRLGMMCLTRLIEQEILYHHALENNVTVESDVVKERAQAQYDTLAKNFSESEGREITEAEMLERLQYEKRSDIDDEIRRAMVVAKMRERIVKEHVANLSPDELERIYEKNVDNLVTPDAVRLNQIFIRGDQDNPDARAAAKKRADEALGKIFQGQRFQTVAEEYSDLPGRVDTGLEPVKDLPEFLKKTVATMKPGDISDVVESEFGYHIFMFVESKEGNKLTREQAEDAIRYQMAMKQSGSVIRDFCEEQIEAGLDVVVFLELEQNLARLNGGKLPEF